MPHLLDYSLVLFLRENGLGFVWIGGVNEEKSVAQLTRYIAKGFM
jgi:hypothetical protein